MKRKKLSQDKSSDNKKKADLFTDWLIYTTKELTRQIIEQLFK
ncbi:hypothetical protein [Staphylococcus capitis]|nr:hypothetical protein [Staphylococcus capitis]